MTGLFDLPKIRIVKREVAVNVVKEVGRVAESVSVLPNLPPQVAQINPSDSATPNTDFLDDAEISFAGEKSPTDAILEMSGDDDAFAVKGVTPFPPAFMAAQVQADYHDEIFGENNNVSVMLRNLCRWASRYNSSKKGERAKLTFSALGAEKQAEFQLEKEAKGMLPK